MMHKGRDLIPVFFVYFSILTAGGKYGIMVGRAPPARGEILIIPHPPQFCQAIFSKKLHKFFSQNLCILPIVLFRNF